MPTRSTRYRPRSNASSAAKAELRPHRVRARANRNTASSRLGWTLVLPAAAGIGESFGGFETRSKFPRLFHSSDDFGALGWSAWRRLSARLARPPAEPA